MINTTNPSAIICIDLKKFRIRIHKSMLHLIGDPKYIQLLVSPQKMDVAILSVEHAISGDQTHKLRQSLSSDNSYEIYSRPFIEKLCAIVGNLETNCSYRLTGEVITAKKVAVFSLKTLTPLAL